MFSKAADTDAAVHSFRLAVFHGRLFLNPDVRKIENDFLQEEAKKIRLENVCNSFEQGPYIRTQAWKLACSNPGGLCFK